MAKVPVAVGRIFAGSGQLKQLTMRAARMARLEAALHGMLPAPLRDHVRLGAIEQGCLVLVADGAAWATRLRYLTPQILAHLPPEPEMADVRSVRVRLRGGELESAPPPTERARMSRAAARSIAAQAQSTSDTRLRAALERLARRGTG